MNTDRKISVITPNYNHAHFLPEMLESTLSQSLPPYEIIIIDDASTDNSVAVIENYQKKHPCIKLLKNEINQGAPHAVNKGIGHASGDYFVFRSADDINMPGFFEKSVALLEKYPSAGVCCSDLLCFSNNDINNAVHEPAGFTSRREFVDKESVPLVVGSNSMHAHTVVARARAILDTGGYIPALKWYADWFCLTAAAFRNGFCYIPEPLVAARLSSDSYGNTTSSKAGVQKKILKRLLLELKNDYKDLIPSFAKSGILEMFYPHIVNTFFEFPELWQPEINMLLHSALWRWNNEHEDLYYKRGLATVIRRRIQETHGKVQEVFASKSFAGVGVYGAGGHTKVLLDIWNELGMPRIDVILTTTLPEQDSFCGIPLRHIGEINADELSLVIISSKSYEESMVKTLQNQLQEVPVLTFWNKKLSSL